MYFDGDLQSGISFALRESKLVVCFVKGDDDASRLWEVDYLGNEEVVAKLEANAVLLQIHAASQEAGYLSAFYPISETPTVIVISNGHLLADIRPGVSLDEFKLNILQSLENNMSGNGTGNPSHLQSATEPGQQTASAANAVLHPLPQNTDAHVHPEIQSMFAERRHRLEQEEKAKDAAERAERRAKAEARLNESDTVAPGSTRAKQLDYAKEQKMHRLEVRQERKRILKAVENDRLERKLDEELRRAQVRAGAGAEGNDDFDASTAQKLSSEVQTTSKASKYCALQVRLLDGGTIRSKFNSDQSLGKHVREWIDQDRSDRDRPYTFKHVLTPTSTHPITISNEQESLQSLGLTPTATLIMVPVQRYTAAYSPGAGYLSKGLLLARNALLESISFLASALGNLAGNTAEKPTANSQHIEESTKAEKRRERELVSNVRTLREQRPKEDEQQVYNGNQLNFEPRKDEDTDADK